MTMADTIAVMNEGRIERMGTASAIYEDPQTAFVSGFLGASNLMHADVVDASRGEVALADGTRLHVAPDRLPAGTPTIQLGVRPEKIHLVSADSPAEGNVLAGRVIDASFIGVSTHYLVETGAVAQLAVMIQNLGDRGFGPGDRVQAAWRPEHTFAVT